MFAIAEKLEYRDGNPVSRVDAPKADERDPVILTDQQLEELLAECEHNPMLWLYILTLAETGARCESEVLWLQWQDVSLEEPYIYIDSSREGHRTKSGKGRHVPMTERLLAAMKEHFAAYRFATYDGKRSDWLFHHMRTCRTARAGDRLASLRRSFEAARGRAGLPGAFTQHDLRHRRVTTWLAEGNSVVTVRKAMGHSSLATTMIYEHFVKEDLLSLVRSSGHEDRQRQVQGS